MKVLEHQTEEIKSNYLYQIRLRASVCYFMKEKRSGWFWFSCLLQITFVLCHLYGH